MSENEKRREKIVRVDLDTSVVVEETYHRDHHRHRHATEGPAYILRQAQTGELTLERYYWNGRLHREGGPALVLYGFNNVPHQEEYWWHGALHRDPKEGPAFIEYTADGSRILIEHFIVYGKPYRDAADGPNYIVRDEETYSTLQEEYSSPEEVRPTRSSARAEQRYRKHLSL